MTGGLFPSIFRHGISRKRVSRCTTTSGAQGTIIPPERHPGVMPLLLRTWVLRRGYLCCWLKGLRKDLACSETYRQLRGHLCHHVSPVLDLAESGGGEEPVPLQVV